MTYTTRTAAQAAAKSKLYSTYQTGMCLNFVWNCLDAPQRIYTEDANQAWYKATKKVTTGTPPAGAPVYFYGGQHGHIALSLGGGFIRSTDWPYKGRVGTVNIGDLCRDWYGTQANYRGWSRDLAGHLISGLQTTSTTTTWNTTSILSNIPVGLTAPIHMSNLRIGRSNAEVSRYQAALWNRLPSTERQAFITRYGLSRAQIYNGYYGSATAAMTSRLYTLIRLPAASEPGPKMMRHLGFTSIY